MFPLTPLDFNVTTDMCQLFFPTHSRTRGRHQVKAKGLKQFRVYRVSGLGFREMVNNMTSIAALRDRLFQLGCDRADLARETPKTQAPWYFSQ